MRSPSRDGTKPNSPLSASLDVSLLASLPLVRLRRRECSLRFRERLPARVAALSARSPPRDRRADKRSFKLANFSNKQQNSGQPAQLASPGTDTEGVVLCCAWSRLTHFGQNWTRHVALRCTELSKTTLSLSRMQHCQRHHCWRNPRFNLGSGRSLSHHVTVNHITFWPGNSCATQRSDARANV